MTAQNEAQKNRNGFPAQTCPKCLGEGELPKFGHVDSGVCFKCKGEGVVLTAKVAKVQQEWREAVLAAQAGTVAEIEAGTQFLVARQWQTALAAPVVKENGQVTVKTSRGSVGWKNANEPIRIHRAEVELPKAADYIAKL